MNRGIIYYTSHRVNEVIMKTVQSRIAQSGLPIVSVSLKPIDFGENIVIDGEPGARTLARQILAGLEEIQADVVFFCEHDVLYHPSHFEFSPLRADAYFYNTNVWRWIYPTEQLISYDHLVSTSGLCASRGLLLNHYRKRMELIERKEWENGRNPKWARCIGYEPGKPRRKGGFMDEAVDEWKSTYPNIDIRHRKTMTPAKVTLESFIHKPGNWRETTLDKIEGWEPWNFRM